jgi:hypothetical protein
MAKGWRFELDHERLVDRSATWSLAPAEARPWLLMLWMTAWRQKPAGSFEADEKVIAARIGMPSELWSRHREVLLRNWWVATDGRMYHDFIAELVLEMMAKRRSVADRQAARRARARDGAPDPDDSDAITGESRVTNAGLHGECGGSSTPTTDHLLPTTEGKEVPGSPEIQTPLPPLQGGSPSIGPPTASAAASPPEAPTPKPRRRRSGPSPLLLGVDALTADGVDPQHAAEWLAIRKHKALPLTQTAWDDLKQEAIKAQLTPAQAVETAVKRGWAGFRATWLLADPDEGTQLHRRTRPDVPRSHSGFETKDYHAGITEDGRIA